MIIHIYSLIYILLLHIPVLTEKIVYLCFSLDYVLETQKTRPAWRNQFATHLLTVIRRVASSFFTTKQTSVEISIVNFSFTFLFSQGCLNRSFLAPTGCFVRHLSLKLFFAEGWGRAFILEKQGHKFFP